MKFIKILSVVLLISVFNYGQTAEDYMESGKLLLKNGEISKAIEEFTKAIEIDSLNAMIFYERGMAYYSLADSTTENAAENYKFAVRDLTETLALDPERVEIYRLLGAAKYKIYDLQGAVADMSEYLKEKPDDAGAYSIRGQAKYYLRNYHSAIVDFNKAIELAPESADSYYFRGMSRIQIKDTVNACADFKLAEDYGSLLAGSALDKYCSD